MLPPNPLSFSTVRCVVLGVVLRGWCHHVASLLADAWQDFAGHPMLESLGTFELGREDEGVETGFVDEGHRA